MMKNLRNSALVVAALTAATFTSAPQRAAAQTYQIDCAILLCLSGGGPHPCHAPGREQNSSVVSHPGP